VQVSISARHGDLSEDSHNKISAKVTKLTRFFDRITAIAVTCDLRHHDIDNVGLEIRVSAEGTDDFVANDSGSNVLAALDGSLHKMEKQLRKHKEKLTGHRQSGHKHIDSEIPNSEEEE